MSSYSLPISSSSTKRLPKEIRSVRYKITLPSRKRKRDSSTPEQEAEDAVLDDDFNPLPVSTNPLSLTPAELSQYKLAGLAIDEYLPNVKDFPHRALPTSKLLRPRSRSSTRRKGHTDQDDVAEDLPGNHEDSQVAEDVDVMSFREGIGPRLRMQHFKVMVAILHRCLREGDMQRALRAWTILLRVQFNNKMLDIRSTDYWAIGAELLARSEELQNEKGEPAHPKIFDGDGGEIKEWGTKSGRAKAVDYLGTLVLEFPYNKHFWKSISAVDFWPSMLAIEIYGIQFEQKRLLREIARHLQADIDEIENGDISADSEVEDGGILQDLGNKVRRLQLRKEEAAWSRRDQVRETTLTAAESLAKRVDELLGEPLYTANNTITEIRAHLAFYIGDLHVPEMPLEGSIVDGQGSHNQHSSTHKQRAKDYERGQRNRQVEVDRAKALVRKIISNGGHPAELIILINDSRDDSSDD
jgi:hypothetical protein